MNKKWIFLAGIIFIIGIYASLTSFKNSSKSFSTVREDASFSAPSAAQTFTAEPVSEKRAQAFQVWFQKEALELEKSSGDPHEQEQRLREVVRQLDPTEVQALQKTFLSDGASANAMILSMYLLTLAPEVTAGALEEISVTPLKFTGEQTVHSPEETLAMQEKSLRRMALDALFTRAEVDLEQRERLRKIVAQIPGRSLREYAEKRLKSMR